MSIYLRWGGVALLMIGALLVSRCYESYLKKRLAEYRGLLSLITHIEGGISKFLAYGDGLWRDFSDGALEKCGLLPALREGKSLSVAFEESRGNTSLSGDARERIAEAFNKLGKGYKDGELKLLSSVRESLTCELDSESAEAEKNIKVARALLLGGALAVGIMVI